MITLPEEFSQQISEFARVFATRKVFENAKTLLLGAILSIGRRTVCSCLRSVGLGQEKRFHKYHWVLSMAEWSPHRAAQVLLRLLVNRFHPSQEPLVFGIDEMIERRWGPRISTRGIYRDSVNSSKSHFVKCSGLRWVSLMLLSPNRWANRIWALPCLTVLAPSERYHQKRGKRHKTILDWARQMLLQLKRWLPNKTMVVVGDSSYAALEFLEAVRPHVTFITRLRLDAALYEPAPARKPGQGGRPAKKGDRIPKLEARLEDPNTSWVEITIPNWYNQGPKQMLCTTGTAVWYSNGRPAVPIRWVLLKDPEGKIDPAGLLCTDQDLGPFQILNFFIRRWTVEVTFQEAKAHLGVGTQRQWSDRAIQRTTPILLGLFSIVTLWADQLHDQGLLTKNVNAWYQKPHPTFSDALAAVRKRCYQQGGFCASTFRTDVVKTPRPLLDLLWSVAARAA